MTLIIGLLFLDLLVIIHEAGHFIAARISKVDVEAFSIGMGPVLLHRTINGTDWRLSLIPLGGYCAMKGETDEDIQTGSMFSIHPLYRAFIAFSGPLSNYLFAVFAYACIAFIGYSYYASDTTIIIPDTVSEFDSPAKEAGLITGDKIISINNQSVSDFTDVYQQISQNPDKDLLIKVKRNNKELSYKVHSKMNKSTGEGKIGVMSDPSTFELRNSKTYSFFQSIEQGIRESNKTLIVSIKSLTLLFKGIDLSKAVSGPAQITSILGNTAKEGFSAGLKTGIISMLQFLALISLSLFIMNLLPIPVLDGGLIVLSIIESVTGRIIPKNIKQTIQMIGFAFILIIFAIAVNGDINYFLRLFNAK